MVSIPKGGSSNWFILLNKGSPFFPVASSISLTRLCFSPRAISLSSLSIVPEDPGLKMTLPSFLKIET
ncbi:MAG: hypothetical protein FJ214_06280 [Ignavibacteria bacterium]|nr:hypothetical protein [Ignavibacteria bacterium]